MTVSVSVFVPLEIQCGSLLTLALDELAICKLDPQRRSQFNFSDISAQYHTSISIPVHRECGRLRRPAAMVRIHHRMDDVGGTRSIRDPAMLLAVFFQAGEARMHYAGEGLTSRTIRSVLINLGPIPLRTEYRGCPTTFDRTVSPAKKTKPLTPMFLGPVPGRVSGRKAVVKILILDVGAHATVCTCTPSDSWRFRPTTTHKSRYWTRCSIGNLTREHKVVSSLGTDWLTTF
ncbi:hypothetical protein DFH07DRAFT_483327 [Mycena maculata]|uniref:Uncharacterized protein n=1 Tax=Mycena maculata TaxID=230809 RepID=A0AAD7J5L2_9AGAR|nr:hypothetical protein DFH07DRAFT_483327 [Mycena maculata]